jgi:hypothetical protein
VLSLVAAADDAVDEAQPLLAELMGVPNPDAADTAEEDGGDDGEAADDESRATVIPDHTTRARERLSVLAGRRR